MTADKHARSGDDRREAGRGEVGDQPALLRYLPRRGAGGEEILDAFLAYVEAQGIRPYPAQEEAILEIASGRNVVLNTPTGSGKTLIATATHFKALAERKRSYYTSPIKALASEKFFALCREFGAEHVGMITGDAAINRDAPIICCTAEVLANLALREGRSAAVDYCVIDEFHYYSDRDRGVAWEVPLLTLPQATFVLMSATIGNPEYFVERLTKLTGRSTALVRSEQRPVPLEWTYSETAQHEVLEELVEAGRAPVYVVHFTQRAAAETAQSLLSVDFCSKDEKRIIHEALQGVRFDSPYGKDVQKYVRHGVGLHHAGLLPKYRLLIEKLAQKGLLKVICGTDTLGVGVNVPIRTVLFTQLYKFDGSKTALLSVRDFRQIAGRAGRKGFDNVGYVVVQAPEHVIENLKLEAKAGGDPAKLRKIVRRKPPENGFVNYDRGTFDRLRVKEPEALQSQFKVSHSMLLHLIEGQIDTRRGGYGALIRLIDASALDARRKRHERATAKLLFRSLLEAGVLETFATPGRAGRRVRVSMKLQQEFAMNQPLGLWLVETVAALDREAPSHPLDVLTLCECIVENPDAVLVKQLDAVKRAKLDELKAQGVVYEDRIAELEKLEYPKPMREFVYETFNVFAKAHPWLGEENVRPKSVAREMYERYASFDEYVRDYGLQRSEGVLLRYLSDVYKVLVQTVPESVKDDAVIDVAAYLRAVIRRVDSSLVDEWESLQSGPAQDGAPPSADPRAQERERERAEHEALRALAARVRAEMHLFLRALAGREYEQAIGYVRDGDELAWSAETLEQAMRGYWEDYDAIRTDLPGRDPRLTVLTPDGEGRWRVRQVIPDPLGDGMYFVEGTVDRAAIHQAKGDPVVALSRIAIV
jgi:superfamily II RNA helicase